MWVLIAGGMTLTSIIAIGYVVCILIIKAHM